MSPQGPFPRKSRLWFITSNVKGDQINSLLKNNSTIRHHIVKWHICRTWKYWMGKTQSCAKLSQFIAAFSFMFQHYTVGRGSFMQHASLEHLFQQCRTKNHQNSLQEWISAPRTSWPTPLAIKCVATIRIRIINHMQHLWMRK